MSIRALLPRPGRIKRVGDIECSRVLLAEGDKGSAVLTMSVV